VNKIDLVRPEYEVDLSEVSKLLDSVQEKDLASTITGQPSLKKLQYDSLERLVSSILQRGSRYISWRLYQFEWYPGVTRWTEQEFCHTDNT